MKQPGNTARFACVALLLAIAVCPDVNAHDLSVEILPRFNGAPLVFDALTNVTATGQRISVTRLDFLLSNLALRQSNGEWLAPSNQFAFANGREGRRSFQLAGLPSGRYDRIRFNVGVPTKENHANPAPLAADHPLNPNVNGLHWNWQGGYVFLALEGDWLRPDGRQGGYSWHLATDRLLMAVELPVALDAARDRELRLALNVEQIFMDQRTFEISDETSSTHSRADDALAVQLGKRIERAFAVETTPDPRPISVSSEKKESAPLVVIASNATPYRFSFSRFFPQPALPLDNPLTEEGVELGRRLFHDTRLSINNRQSCASCHQAGAAFADGRQFSAGAEGQAGTRNAMSLFNLAWKNSFFWDGRAPSLREQVLMPIENPIEMHETLTNVVAKLRGEVERKNELRVESGQRARCENSQLSTQILSQQFSRAFGSPDITADRIARALEQFLLTQVSHDSRFDRSLNGEVELTDEEKRGFELFNTEYDPRHGQSGADCFHCHGGPLFQSQSFANNGLDDAFADPGRFLVTKKEGDRGKFAVPSLRNVAVTAPYMHDGRFATLDKVVEHYTSGVKRSATLDPNLAKHPDGGVPLSSEDKRALVAFLKTLTDERFTPTRGKLAGIP